MADEPDNTLPMRGQPQADERALEVTELSLERGAAYRQADPQEEDESAGGGFTLRDVLYVIFRHKYKIVLIFLLLSVATLVYVASVPQLFESEALVLIRGDRTALAVDPSGEGNSFLKGDREDIRARTEIGLMQSSMLAERVVDQIGPEKILDLENKPLADPNRPRNNLLGLRPLLRQLKERLHLVEPDLTLHQRAVSNIMAHLTAAPTMSESTVLRVTYASSSPQMARKVLDALIAAYLQNHIEIHKALVSPEFFRQKSQELKAQLTQKENELDQERKRLKISSLEGQKNMLLTQFSTLDTNLRENSAQVNATEAKLRMLESMQKKRQSPRRGNRPALSSNPAADQVRARLIELKLKEADLSARFTPESGELQDVRIQIQELERMLKSEKNEGFGVDLGVDQSQLDLELQVQLARADLEAQNARELSLTREVTALRKEIDTLAGNEKELHRLEREVALVENEYRQYLNSLQVSEISTALDRDKISNVSIVQPATLPLGPAKSQRKILALLAFGIFLGLAVGVGWAFVLEFCDHSLKTAEDIEKYLSLPVLVSLPLAKRHKPELQEEIA